MDLLQACGAGGTRSARGLWEVYLSQSVRHEPVGQVMGGQNLLGQRNVEGCDSLAGTSSGEPRIVDNGVYAARP
jgi:hypothetical protein